MGATSRLDNTWLWSEPSNHQAIQTLIFSQWWLTMGHSSSPLSVLSTVYRQKISRPTLVIVKQNLMFITISLNRFDCMHINGLIPVVSDHNYTFIRPSNLKTEVDLHLYDMKNCCFSLSICAGRCSFSFYTSSWRLNSEDISNYIDPIFSQSSL